MIVKPRVSQAYSTKYASVFMKEHSLSMTQCAIPNEQRYHVWHGQSFNDRIRLGVVFREAGYWIFYPDSKHGKPNEWFFGLTRCDAISGYLKAVSKEADPE